VTQYARSQGLNRFEVERAVRAAARSTGSQPPLT
jgi:hypothetical protein